MPNALASSCAGSPAAERRRNCSCRSGLSFGGFGGRQAPGAAGFAGCGATLADQFEFEFGEGGHDGGDGAPGWGAGVDSFSSGAQRDSTMAATEPWPPNVGIATQLLHPLGAVVMPLNYCH
jgi:hypothetical protein